MRISFELLLEFVFFVVAIRIIVIEKNFLNSLCSVSSQINIKSNIYSKQTRYKTINVHSFNEFLKLLADNQSS